MARRVPIQPLLRIDGLLKQFRLGKQTLTALNHTSLEIFPGEVLGLVGESGCGKSTLARTLLRLIEPDAGAIWFEGEDLCKLRSGQMKAKRRELQMVFQDPYASLNPRMTVENIVGEPLDIHRMGGDRRAQVCSLLERVGLNPRMLHRYPHEFSGGEKQRIGIARALASKPKFLILDEPTSALDLSIQAQVINLLKSLQEEMGLTYLFISHNLSIVRAVADRIAVMYRGTLVEIGPARRLFQQPEHPYTQRLLASMPLADPIKEKARLAKPPSEPIDFDLRAPLIEVADGHYFRAG